MVILASLIVQIHLMHICERFCNLLHLEEIPVVVVVHVILGKDVLLILLVLIVNVGLYLSQLIVIEFKDFLLGLVKLGYFLLLKLLDC